MPAGFPGLAYARLNLRRNPFGEPRREERALLAVVDVESLAQRLGHGCAIQFLGDSGRGKTTHLLALRTRFPSAPFITFLPGEVPPIQEGPVLFLDEVQRLRPRERARLFRCSTRLAIGSHEDHAREIASAGMKVDTVRLQGLGPEDLAVLVARRIEWARRGPGPVPVVARESLRVLLARHGSDLRGIEDELYEVFQRLEGTGRVEV
jgi:hypothetical protein